MTPEQRYESLVRSILAGSRSVHVDEGKGFGSTGQLKVDGRIFAMLVRGELVLKLPADRVDSLVDSGEGQRFDAGKSKPMREWFALSPTSTQPWLALVKEALRFVEEIG
jgi:TfoX/Sxy family transcriptional regulator of competence genes